MFPAKVPDLELETIPPSHFVEKARWCLDRLGVEYTEKPEAGINGVMFRGRSVPQLRFRTGIVRSSIGNSPEILRYLWGRYAVECGDAAEFLRPTAERLAMEDRLDRYGAHLQVWVYYHILEHPDVVMHAWGRNDASVPDWQRLLLPIVFPLNRWFLRKVFRINDAHYHKVVEKIESLLDDVEANLDDGRRSILGSEDTDFVDITFAALSTIWLRPEEFAAGKAEASRIGQDEHPPAMAADIERWSDRYPLAKAFVERLYREERVTA
jgi:glutathione S-transferase